MHFYIRRSSSIVVFASLWWHFKTLPLCPGALLRGEILSPSLKHLSQDERVGLRPRAKGRVHQNLIKMDLRSRLMSNKGTSGGFSAQREHLQPWNQVKRRCSAIEFVASAAGGPSETKSSAQTIRPNNGPRENNHALSFLMTQQSISFEGFVILKSAVSSKLNLKQIVPWHPNGYASLFILCLKASALGIKINFLYCFVFFFTPRDRETLLTSLSWDQKSFQEDNIYFDAVHKTDN